MTPDTRLSRHDLDAALNDRIDRRTTAADAAAADAATALDAADDALDQVATLAGDTIADLEALLAELGGIDAGDIVAARLLALAALQTGWNADPTFQLWTSGCPTSGRTRALPHMARSSPASTAAASRSTSAPARPGHRRAASDVAGQMRAADPEARGWCSTRWSPSPPARRRAALRAEWLAHGASTWTAATCSGHRAGRHASPSMASPPGPA